MGRFHLDHNVSYGIRLLCYAIGPHHSCGKRGDNASVQQDSVSRQIADLLRQSGHDVVTARNLGLDDADDDVHLLTALLDDRIFVTHNGHDFILLHYAWRRWTEFWRIARPHAGVLIVPQMPHLSPLDAAREVDRLQVQAALSNELYEYDWQTLRAWVRHPPP